jgi:glycosyltransferase EpsD
MKKLLFVATIDQHIRHFHIPFLRWFKTKGFQVSVASNGDEKVPYVDSKHDVSFERKPFSIKNIKAFFELRNILKINNYKLIHTHTPVASIIVRIANYSLGRPAKIIYTAHGFHFYRGAKLLNWLIYYPIEKILSYCTDFLVTINEEDYNNAIKNNFGCKYINLVDGVGVNLEKFKVPTDVEKNKLRMTLELNINDFTLIYVGELSQRKNQELLLHAVADLSTKIKNLKVLLVGKGPNESKLKSLCSYLELDDIVKFLGYRDDIEDLMKVADISVSTAFQEGLPVNVMESLSTGLPCVVSNCRGNRDIIINNYNGFVIEVYDSVIFSEKIYQLYSERELFESIKNNTEESVMKYSEESVMKSMTEIYLKCIRGLDE